MVLLLVLLPSCLWASDDWNRTDVMFEATYLTLHVVDWGQTLNIVSRDDKYHERNIILGKHPSRGDVNTYFAVTALLHVALANYLDRPARNYFQIGTIALEAAVIGNNYQIGLKTSF